MTKMDTVLGMSDQDAMTVQLRTAVKYARKYRGLCI